MASSIACPLTLCSEEHLIKHAKNRNQTAYVSCPNWRSIVWFKTPVGERYLADRVKPNPPPARAADEEEDDGLEIVDGDRRILTIVDGNEEDEWL